MGVAARTVESPDGREWQVRVYRFRLPPWRRFGPLFEEAPELSLFFPIELVLAIVSAFLGALVLPFLAAVVRQLELGYNRVEPHNAVFEGFAGS